jgi:DNA-binding LacI/PurR family transcriptional regulator
VYKFLQIIYKKTGIWYNSFMDSKPQTIYRDLANRIARGDLCGKTTLPTEEALAKQYGCSRPTLRKAVRELKRTGMVNSVRGSGVYIAAPQSDRDNLFAIIFPNLGPGHFSDPVCSLLARHTSARGDSIVWGGYISPKSDTLRTDVRQICEQYIARNIAGLFFSPFEYHSSGDEINREITEVISQAGIPLVLIDSDIRAYPAQCDFDLVSMDHVQAAYILTEHVIEQGFRRIFFFAPPYSRHTIKLRLMGYNAALIDRGFAPEALVVCDTGDTASFLRFIQSKKPDAIICSNDITAAVVVDSLEKLGLQVPDDIAVAGFDCLSKALPLVLPITSIEQPLDAIAGTALRLMLDRIASPQNPPTRVIFPGKLFPEITTLKGQ